MENHLDWCCPRPWDTATFRRVKLGFGPGDFPARLKCGGGEPSGKNAGECVRNLRSAPSCLCFLRASWSCLKSGGDQTRPRTQIRRCTDLTGEPRSKGLLGCQASGWEEGNRTGWAAQITALTVLGHRALKIGRVSHLTS